jgi:hypothetical protein
MGNLKSKTDGGRVFGDPAEQDRWWESFRGPRSAGQPSGRVIGGPAEQDRWWESREKGRNEHKKDDKENI